MQRSTIAWERWLSGLKRLPAKQELRKRGARVRIPLSPPVVATGNDGEAPFLIPSLQEWQILKLYAPIAQLDRVSDYESEGWRFDSSWAHQPSSGYDLSGVALLYLVVLCWSVGGLPFQIRLTAACSCFLHCHTGNGICN